MAEGKSKLRLSDMGPQIQNLLKALKNANIDDGDAELLEFVSVRDIAKVYDQQSKNLDQQQIWENLMETLRQRRLQKGVKHLEEKEPPARQAVADEEQCQWRNICSTEKADMKIAQTIGQECKNREDLIWEEDDERARLEGEVQVAMAKEEAEIAQLLAEQDQLKREREEEEERIRQEQEEAEAEKQRQEDQRLFEEQRLREEQERLEKEQREAEEAAAAAQQAQEEPEEEPTSLPTTVTEDEDKDLEGGGILSRGGSRRGTGQRSVSSPVQLPLSDSSSSIDGATSTPTNTTTTSHTSNTTHPQSATTDDLSRPQQKNSTEELQRVPIQLQTPKYQRLCAEAVASEKKMKALSESKGEGAKETQAAWREFIRARKSLNEEYTRIEKKRLKNSKENNKSLANQAGSKDAPLSSSFAGLAGKFTFTRKRGDSVPQPQRQQQFLM
eukprot:TRINITY_DN52354_c0_g1_i1.p1 TRINITY_DN52354_c0_g1~~TRINITY_DN52354_c0_g1_i1.p1  ORF type:complete len:443 (-),score=70.40 TRINITY_DN52354_c0_g1_i1:57-1385(-)